LLPDDGAALDEFGYAASISGDVAAVAARRDDDGGLDTGSVYVFRFGGSNWTQRAKLTAHDAASGDEFGTAVSISWDTIVVGAALSDEYGLSSGSAYVYRFIGGASDHRAHCTPSRKGKHGRCRSLVGRH